MVAHCRVFHDVHRKRSFSHAGARRKHYQIGFLQSVRQLIEAAEARFHAAVRVLVEGKRFEFLQHAVHHVFFLHAFQRRTVGLPGNIVNTFFGKRQRLLFVGGRSAGFYDFLRSADEFSRKRIALHDIEIRFIVRRGRRNLRQFRQVGNPAGFRQIALAFQLIGKGYEIDGTARAEHSFHRAQHVAVAFAVEILFFQRFHDVRRRFVIDQHTPQKRHFRVVVVRQHVGCVRHNFPLSPSVILPDVLYLSSIFSNASSVSSNSFIAVSKGAFAVRSTPARFKMETGSVQHPPERNEK